MIESLSPRQPLRHANSVRIGHARFNVLRPQCRPRLARLCAEGKPGGGPPEGGGGAPDTPKKRELNLFLDLVVQ